jgi:hypothetical protein
MTIHFQKAFVVSDATIIDTLVGVCKCKGRVPGRGGARGRSGRSGSRGRGRGRCQECHGEGHGAGDSAGADVPDDDAAVAAVLHDHAGVPDGHGGPSRAAEASVGGVDEDLDHKSADVDKVLQASSKLLRERVARGDIDPDNEEQVRATLGITELDHVDVTGIADFVIEREFLESVGLLHLQKNIDPSVPATPGAAPPPPPPPDVEVDVSAAKSSLELWITNVSTMLHAIEWTAQLEQQDISVGTVSYMKSRGADGLHNFFWYRWDKRDSSIGRITVLHRNNTLAYVIPGNTCTDIDARIAAGEVEIIVRRTGAEMTRPVALRVEVPMQMQLITTLIEQDRSGETNTCNICRTIVKEECSNVNHWKPAVVAAVTRFRMSRVDGWSHFASKCVQGPR